MLLTPTFVGLLLAGAAFWTLVWAAIHKLDEIPCLKEISTTQEVLDAGKRSIPSPTVLAFCTRARRQTSMRVCSKEDFIPCPKLLPIRRPLS